MYLKSLALKGFKSFADRSVLMLQPGVTAIVGPNGSGKSNISDAVLWVLGERSARNLRGQAMEDIIFSGSAARKAVSIAEVDLVLDYSDHVLPVDFDEVSITRRMYRSGESEYLLNGVVARRLDVLDILHDTGLGTGTHSIISQGSLDSILQSKPEDRRALIEEAAGVLKHKRRKQKSQRKLEQMQNNLDRVRDVTAEVARQLGPLERKAKRAEAYQKAKGDLMQVKLALAVDDLRILQQEWDELCAAEQAALAAVDQKREAVESTERIVNDYQELMRRESQDANVIARQQRRASNLSERLDSVEILLREKRRASDAQSAELSDTLRDFADRRLHAVAELVAAQEQFNEVSELSAKAEELVAGLSESREGLKNARRAAEEAVSVLGRQLGECERELESSRRELATLKESLATGMAQVKIVEARRQEFDSDLHLAQMDHEQSQKSLTTAKEALDALQARESELRERLAVQFEERDAAHSLSDSIHKDMRLAQAELEAVQKAIDAARADDPALDWVARNPQRFGGELAPVSRAFKVSRGLEALVEQLLGFELSSLAVADASCAQEIAQALAQAGLIGNVPLVMRNSDAHDPMRRSYEGALGHALLDELTYPEQMESVVQALLGDVVLCDTRDQAFEAHAQSDGSWRFVSRDGCVVGPSRKVVVLGARQENAEGLIARERRLEELAQRVRQYEQDGENANKAVLGADEAYRTLQAESLQISQQLANSKGAYESALAEEQRCARRVENVLRDIEQSEMRLAAASQEVEGVQPAIDNLLERIAVLDEKRNQLLADRRSKNDELAPLRRETSQLDEKFADARLRSATLLERKTYTQRLFEARTRDIEQLDANAEQARATVGIKAASSARAQDALKVLGILSASLGRRVRLLDDALNASETSANSVHANVAMAREEARKAHDEYDSASSRMAQVRVDKGRLEMRVEAAVNVIVNELQMPLERVQDIPKLENRRETEDESFRLERKIRNMGTINPDAAEEYAQLKERYDYLAGQLADMEAARRSLSRIVKVIDERMKDDFVRTFELVNNNFAEVFGILFPGGTAYLTLDDPDDIDNAGVEVTAQPRGKRLTKMMLMSGGEKSLTALALLFAVYKTRATPFYILDEVEAALDDTNLRRLMSYIDTLRDTTQLIMITHQRRTMEAADVLFGVSMQVDGVTKVVSQRLERALEHAE